MIGSILVAGWLCAGPVAAQPCPEAPAPACPPAPTTEAAQLAQARTIAQQLDATRTNSGGATPTVPDLVWLACHGGTEDQRRAHFSLGRLHFDAGRLPQALRSYRTVVDDAGAGEARHYAASLYLEAVHQSRNVDGCGSDALVARAAEFDQLLCIPPPADSSLCETVTQIRCAGTRLRAEAEFEEERWDDAIAGFLAVANDAECNDRDGSLWNAAIASIAGGRTDSAYVLFRRLLSTFPESSLANESMLRLAHIEESIGQFEDAARTRLEIARLFPGGADDCSLGFDDPSDQEAAAWCRSAEDSLAWAAQMWTLLGDVDQAEEAVELFRRNYGRRNPQRATDLAFALLVHTIERGTSRARGRAASEFLAQHRRTATSDQLATAHVALARLPRPFRRGSADPLLEAIAEWNDGALRVPPNVRLDESERLLRTVRLREAVGEALFLRAEDLFSEFMSRRAPVYRGPTSLDKLGEWSRDVVAPWLTDSREALLRVEEAYHRIAETEAPRWEVAAAGRLGEAYRHLREAIERSALSPQVVDMPDFDRLMEQNLEPLLAPLRQRELGLYEFCAVTAIRTRVLTEASTRCTAALTELDEERYPALGELIPDVPRRPASAAPLSPLPVEHPALHRLTRATQTLMRPIGGRE
ncbi:MAG: tetratricopeptide repeat protein [Myxococcota bacterium]